MISECERIYHKRAAVKPTTRNFLEVHLVEQFHKADYIAAGVAAEALPEVLIRSD